MQEPISHQARGIRSSSPIAARSVISISALISVRPGGVISGGTAAADPELAAGGAAGQESVAGGAGGRASPQATAGGTAGQGSAAGCTAGAACPKSAAGG